MTRSSSLLILLNYCILCRLVVDAACTVPSAGSYISNTLFCSVSACSSPSCTSTGGGGSGSAQQRCTYVTQACFPGTTTSAGSNTVTADCTSFSLSSTGAVSYIVNSCVQGSYSTLGTNTISAPCTRSNPAGSSGYSLTCQPTADSSINTGKPQTPGSDTAVCSDGYFGVVTKSPTTGYWTGCNACPVGTYTGTKGASTCLPCPAGQWTSAQGSSSCPAIACSGGYTGVAGACTCSSGFYGTVSYSGPSAIGCTGIPCTNGYSGVAGSCVCDVGYYGTVRYLATSTTGSTSGCIPCPSGKWSFSVDTTAICTSSCGAGYYCNAGRRSPCPSGTNSTATEAVDISTCKVCPAGTKSSPGSSTCSFCPDGYWSTSGSDICSQSCGTGYYCSAGVRTACPLNTYNSDVWGKSISDCIKCEAGSDSFNNVGTAVCTKCASNYYSVSGSSCSPVVCSTGGAGYTGSAGNCYCLPGYYSTSGAKIGYLSGSPVGCSPCGLGYACPGGQSVDIGGTTRLPCSPGTFSNTTTASSCFTCQSGYYSQTPIRSACYACRTSLSVGKYVSRLCGGDSNLEETSCTDSTTGIESFVSQVCNAGSSNVLGVDTAFTKCSTPANNQYVAAICQLGSWKSSGTNTIIMDCTGSAANLNVSDSDAFVKSICVPGSAQVLGQDTSFMACTKPSSASYVKYACDHGQALSSSGTQTAVGTDTLIEPCDRPLQYDNYVTQPCVTGDIHTVGNNTILAPCKKESAVGSGYFYNQTIGCVPGDYNLVGADSAIQVCPPGFFCDGINKAQPQVCGRLGYYCAVGSTTEIECPPNYYCPNGIEPVPCQGSQYSDAGKNKATDCKCLPDFYRQAGITAGTNCTECPPGGHCIGFNTMTFRDSPPVAIAGFTATVDITTFDKCLPEEGCPGGTTIYDVMYAQGNSTVFTCKRRVLNADMKTEAYDCDICEYSGLGRSCMPLCKNGYTGLYCGSCQLSGDLRAYRSGGFCHLCSDQNQLESWGLVILFLLVVSLALYAFAKLKIDTRVVIMTITFVQTIASFNQIKLNWSAPVRQYFNMASTLNVNIDLVKAECYQALTFETKWVYIQLAPLIGLVGLTFLFIIYKQAYNFINRYLQWRVLSIKLDFDHLIYSSIALLDICYFPIATNTLKVYDCISVNGRRVISYSPDIVCDGSVDDTYARLSTYASLSVAAYLICIPLFFLVVMLWNRVDIQADLESLHARSKPGATAAFQKSQSNRTLMTSASSLVSQPSSSSLIGFPPPPPHGGSDSLSAPTLGKKKDSSRSSMSSASSYSSASSSSLLDMTSMYASSNRDLLAKSPQSERRDKSIIRRRYGFLYNAFKPRYYLWKLAVTFRKLIIVYVIIMFNSGDSIFQAMTIFVILMLALLFQHNCNPYLRQSHGKDPLNAIEFFTLLSTGIIIACGVLMHTTTSLQASTTNPRVLANINFKLQFLSFLVMFLITLLLCIYIWIIYRYGKYGILAQKKRGGKDDASSSKSKSGSSTPKKSKGNSFL